MENCKADNISENRFLDKLLEIAQVIMKHLYKGLSKNSCSVDLIDIKNTLHL